MTVTGADAVGELGGSVAGNVALDGGVFRTRAAGATLTGNVTTTASGGRVNWLSNGGIVGTFNASGPVTHENAASGTLTINAASTLNLGGNATGLAVTVNPASGNVTLGRNLVCGALTLSAGTFVRGSYTVTCASLTGDGSGCTATDATIAFNVAGNISVTVAGTWSACGQIVQTASGTVVNTLARRFQSLYLASAAGVTSTNSGVSALALRTGAGTVAMGTNNIALYGFGNDPLNCPATTTWTGTGYIAMSGGTIASQGEFVVGVEVRWQPSSNGTLTATGNWTTAVMTLIGNNPGTATVNMAGYTLRCAGLTLGGSSGYAGAITLGGRTISTANIAAGAGGGTITLASGNYIRMTGTMTGTNITLTNGEGAFVQGIGSTSFVNVTPAAALHCNGVTNTSGNHANCQFTHPPRGAWVAAA
jgi:hypothetical protein